MCVSCLTQTNLTQHEMSELFFFLILQIKAGEAHLQLHDMLRNCTPVCELWGHKSQIKNDKSVESVCCERPTVYLGP